MIESLPIAVLLGAVIVGLTLGLLDPTSRQPAFKQGTVRVEPVDQKLAARLNLEMRTF